VPETHRARPRPASLGRVATLSDFLDVTVDEARVQWRSMLSRRPAGRRVTFTPVETLLCLAASYVVQHRLFGSSSAPRAPEPVQALARLFTRPPSSVLAKMANLDGSRSHGAKWDLLVGTTLLGDPEQLSQVYRVLLAAARAEGVGRDRLPDFLSIEEHGDVQLLGQAQLPGDSMIEEALQGRLEQLLGSRNGLTEPETTRLLLAAARVGQNIFARSVLRNCGDNCVFCGMTPSKFEGNRMLVAGHIKPWRHSEPDERLDPRNGLAACPTHDVAFDTGLLAVNGGLRIHLAPKLHQALPADAAARAAFGRPPLAEKLILPEGADPPETAYLDWHRERVYAA
jgi:putative restriction endonuclease